MISDNYRYVNSINYHIDATKKIIKDNNKRISSIQKLKNDIIEYQKHQILINSNTQKNLFQNPDSIIDSTTNINNSDFLNLSQTNIPINRNKANHYCGMNNLSKGTLLNRNSVYNKCNYIKNTNVIGADYKKSSQNLNIIKLDTNIKKFGSSFNLNYRSKKNYLNDHNALQNPKINYLSENTNNTNITVNKHNSIVQYNTIKSSKEKIGKTENYFKSKKDINIIKIKKNIINDDKKKFMQNIKDIQDLNDIGIDNNINDKIHKRTNKKINFTNNLNEKCCKNFELISKNKNMNQNDINHCFTTSKINQEKISNNSRITANQEILNQKNDIFNQKIQNFPSRINLVNRKVLINSHSNSNISKNLKTNNSFKNLRKNNSKTILNCTNMNNIDMREYANINIKNLKKNINPENMLIQNITKKHYSTISDDENFKNTRQNFSISPKHNEFIIGTRKFSLNNTNFMEETSNNINNIKLNIKSFSKNYTNLYNDYIKMKKKLVRLENEIKKKNNCIKELQILNKKNLGKINNLIIFQNKIIDDAKKMDNYYKKQIKSLTNENFLLKNENSEIKKSSNGVANDSKRQIKELEEKIEKYKTENNNLKIIIIRTKNSNQKLVGNDTNYRQEEFEEKKNNKFNSINYEYKENKIEFKSNSLSKFKRKRDNIHIIKNFKEDKEMIEKNSSQKSLAKSNNINRQNLISS